MTDVFWHQNMSYDLDLWSFDVKIHQTMSFTCYNIFTKFHWNFLHTLRVMGCFMMCYHCDPEWSRRVLVQLIWIFIAFYNIWGCYHHISCKISWDYHKFIKDKYNFTSEIWILTLNRNCYRSQYFIFLCVCYTTIQHNFVGII